MNTPGAATSVQRGDERRRDGERPHDEAPEPVAIGDAAAEERSHRARREQHACRRGWRVPGSCAAPSRGTAGTNACSPNCTPRARRRGARRERERAPAALARARPSRPRARRSASRARAGTARRSSSCVQSTSAAISGMIATSAMPGSAEDEHRRRHDRRRERPARDAADREHAHARAAAPARARHVVGEAHGLGVVHRDADARDAEGRSRSRGSCRSWRRGRCPTAASAGPAGISQVARTRSAIAPSSGCSSEEPRLENSSSEPAAAYE